jgi:hypothetical protein
MQRNNILTCLKKVIAHLICIIHKLIQSFNFFTFRSKLFNFYDFKKVLFEKQVVHFSREYFI